MNDATDRFETKVTEHKTYDFDLYDMREYADDIETIRQALIALDVHTSHIMAYNFWSSYSFDMDAGWLTLTDGEVASAYKYFLGR